MREKIAEDKQLIRILEHSHAGDGFILHFDEHFGIHAVAGHRDAQIVQELNKRAGFPGDFLTGAADQLGNHVPVQFLAEGDGTAGRSGRDRFDGRSLSGSGFREGRGRTRQGQHQGQHQRKQFFHSRFLLVFIA